ncbi:MAG TPA: FixH family protein [Chitinophagaceae bacterium]|nr:FixH family protein [Chitinophagaceae bacterium]
MSWGYRLLIVYLLFTGWMGYLVYRSTHVNYELVQDDYYKTELKYQQVIDASKNTSKLSGPVSLNEANGHIDIRFPKEMKNADVKGTAWFYCAYDATKDRHIDLKINRDASQQINIKDFVPGHYVVKFNWTSNDKAYYSELPFTIL